MTNQLQDNHFVWHDFDQTEELARLRDWITRVSRSRPRDKELCQALNKLIHRDLVRFGLQRSKSGVARGFGIVAKWTEIQDIIYATWPNQVAAGIVTGLCDPRIVLLNTGGSDTEPQLVFHSLIFDPASKTHSSDAEKIQAHRYDLRDCHRSCTRDPGVREQPRNAGDRRLVRPAR